MALAKQWARDALAAPFSAADLEVLKAPELTIDAVPKQDVAVDREVIATTPIRVSVGRDALILLVPQTFLERVEADSGGTSAETMP